MGHHRMIAAAAALALVTGAGGAAAAGAAGAAEGALVLAAGAAITAPETVDPGQPVNVVVEGARGDGRIVVWGPIGRKGPGAVVSEGRLVGGTAELTAPLEPGSYELRYVTGTGAVRSKRVMDVASVPVTLTVPTNVGVGGTLEVVWRGPGRAGDRLDIVDSGGAVVQSVPATGDLLSVNTSQLPAPPGPGTYKLRYVTGGGSVLESVPFEVRSIGG